MARLNHSFVREIIKQKNYRKWWVAEQLGISRRTLHRWLSGETEDVPETMLKQLAALLNCSIQDVTHWTKPESTHLDQIAAAQSLISSGVLESLMPAHHFEMFEKLAKGLIVPGLSPTELGNLYMSLALALFRQSKLEEAANYVALAKVIALEEGDRLLELRANMQLSYRAYLQGDARLGLQMDEKPS
jgi:DNA-binding Xre family transcriptional regulator|tara:strand:- start:595 stop:1158 length:564 start_codon:yes stop_codon:yes gene_type:complete